MDNNTNPKVKPFIEQLKYLRSKLHVNQRIRDIFDKLVNHVDAASGQGRDKQHWLDYITQDLICLE